MKWWMTVVIVGCHGTQTAPSMPTPSNDSKTASDPVPTGGPLRIRPAFATLQYSPWAGASMWEGPNAHGWTADSATFVHCRAADWVKGRFTRGCMFVDAKTNATVRTIVSTEDYGGGHGVRDESLAKELDPLGFPAKPGLFRWADSISLTWTASGGDDRGPTDLDFFFENDASGKRVSIASFHASGGMHAFPRDANLSPDGKWIAIVVNMAAGPPLLTVSQVRSVEAAKQLL